MASWSRTSNLFRRGTPDAGRLRRGLVVAELVLVVTAVACSSGSTSGSTPKNASAAPATAPQATDGGSTPAAPASTPVSAAAGTPDGPFCSLRNVANLAVDYDNPDPAAAVVSLQKAVVLAPADIKPAVQTIADAEIPIFQGQVPANQIDQRVGDPKVLKATRDIATWSAAHCK
jgi:hypothetical protein